jgi:hypothetical protein
MELATSLGMPRWSARRETIAPNGTASKECLLLAHRDKKNKKDKNVVASLQKVVSPVCKPERASPCPPPHALRARACAA